MNDRILKITKILLESNEPVTTAYISECINVSKRTIRNDLTLLREYVERNGLNLIRKTGVGTSIDGKEIDKINLLNSLKENESYVTPYSKEDRQNYILQKLFMTSENINTKEMAKELYVCTATIYKDLRAIKEIIKPFNLDLIRKRNYGVAIIGEEKDYRETVSHILSKTKVSNRDNKDKYYSGRIDEQTYFQLKTLLNIDYSCLERYLNEVEKELRFRFSYEAYVSLIIHIAISIKRIQDNKDISIPKETLNSVIATEEFMAAQQLCKRVERAYKVNVPISEIGYIALHILGSKVRFKDLCNMNLSDKGSNHHDLALIMAKEIIEIASESLKIDLTKDRALQNGLILHLRPTINRLKYNMTLKNPLLEEIKENYSDVFGVAWLCSKAIRKYIDTKIPESEIGYIAIHLSAAVERNTEKVRATIVCHSGIGTSQLLSVKLEKTFKELSIINVISASELNKCIYEQSDVIISTVDIESEASIAIIRITPLLNSNDIKCLNQHIEKIKKHRYNKNNAIDMDVLHLSKRYGDKEQLITEICDLLYKRCYIKRDYRDSVLEREKIYSTDIGNGVAIPHGSPDRVKRSIIRIVILDCPIQWGDSMVDTLFFLCVAREDISGMRDIIRSMYGLIDNPKILDKIRMDRSTEGLKDLLYKPI